MSFSTRSAMWKTDKEKHETMKRTWASLETGESPNSFIHTTKCITEL